MLFIFNWALKTGLLLAFSLLGWVTLLTDGTAASHVTWPVVGTAVVVALVFTLVDWLVAVVWTLLSAASFGILLIVGVVLFPLIGWAILALTAMFVPSMIILHSFWITVLCGFILMIAYLRRSSSTVHRTSA